MIQPYLGSKKVLSSKPVTFLQLAYFIKVLRKALLLWKMLKYQILKELGTSYTQKLVLTYNARQNIWAKVNKSMKMG